MSAVLLHPSADAARRISLEHLRPVVGAFLPVIGQRRVERLHGQPNLQMGHDKRRRHDLKAEHALGRRLLDPCASQRTQALIFQIGGNAA